MERILTLPEELEACEEFLPTGNEYVSLPLVTARDGGIDRLNVLHRGQAGLLEFRGGGDAPFIRPALAVDGEKVPAAGRWGWIRLDDWIPRATLHWQGINFTWSIIPPPGEKGFILLLQAENTGGATREVGLAVEGCWCGVLQTVYTSRPVYGRCRIYYDRWARGPVMEFSSGTPLLGLALTPSDELEECFWELVGQADRGCPARGSAGDIPPVAGARTRVALGFPSGDEGSPWLRFHLFRRVSLAPGSSEALALYAGVAREADGARTTAVHLARTGWKELLQRARRFIQMRRKEVPHPRLNRVANLNLLFNYFYSLGRTIDSEDLVAVTSRSPLYYVSAAFWARDTLLWSLPGILLVEPALAREVLLLAYSTYLRHAGTHSLYLDGTLLYPGFELDQLCAYFLALERYLEETGDTSILQDHRVQEGLPYLERILWTRKHPRAFLFSTELYPSDDPAVYPYLTYNNALTWRCLNFLGKLAEASGEPAAAARYRDSAAQVREAILRHCVVEGPFGPMYAWATDLEGHHLLYDEPPGSLQLLAYYGFCAPGEEAYLNTVRWIRSSYNPYYYEGPFPGAGCPHAGYPFVMDLFNRLLSGDQRKACSILEQAPLDGSIACESFDPRTGLPKTGRAFATCAGFLAYALIRSLASGL